MLSKLIEKYRLSRRRKKYQAGAKVVHFVAKDIRREVEVVDASEVDAGYITVRSRTFNVLYVIKGIDSMPGFDEPRRVMIDTLWDWKGAPWGGPVPKE